LAAASAALAAFDRASGPTSKLDEVGKRGRAELEGRVGYLQDLQKNYEDQGESQGCSSGGFCHSQIAGMDACSKTARLGVVLCL